jgi:hypothetical protein
MKKAVLSLLLIICASTMAFSQCSAYSQGSIQYVGKSVKGKTHSEQRLFAGLNSQKRTSVFSTKRRYKLRLSGKIKN